MKNIKFKYLLSLIAFVSIISCKSKSVISEATATKSMNAEKVIDNHYDTKKDFKTAYIKADVSY